MITLDGSYGEGGGQILRTALALSMITQKPFKIQKIRSGRPKPGLKAQHLTGISILCEISKSKVIGEKLGSEELEFHPKPIEKFKANVDVGTAGPITLVLQTILPPLMFSDKSSKIKLIGGTDVSWSPSINYFTNVILPQLKRFADIKIKMEKRGYFPKGGGQVDIKIKPKVKLTDKVNIELTNQGKMFKINGVSHANRELHKADVSERQARAAKIILNKLGVPVTINSQYVDANSIGSGITLWALFGDDGEVQYNNPMILGADSLGEKGKKSEVVGEEAAKNLINEVEKKAIVDSHLADNLIPFIGLFGGIIKTSDITGHIKSNIYVVEKFLDVKFKIDKKNNLIKQKV